MRRFASGLTSQRWQQWVHQVATRFCAAAGAGEASGSSNQIVPQTYRAISWYRREPFDMEHVVSYLNKRNGKSLKVELVFSSTTLHSSSGPHLVKAAAPSGASSALGLTALAPSKSVEIVCFTTTSPNDATTKDPEHPTTFVVFADGSIVGWNAQWQEMMYIREELSASSSKSATIEGGSLSVSSSADSSTPSSTSAAFVVDSMRYELYDRCNSAVRDADDDDEDDTVLTTGESRRNFINEGDDRIVLASSAAKYKIPFSYALAQSVKLDAYRREVDPISQQVKRWQQHLARSGTLLCTLPALRMVKSKLLSLVEFLNFTQYVQTTPRIFWTGEYQLLRSVYRDACVHLEIEDRGASLKQMLDAVDESLSYLHDEVHANTNEFLTLVIIVLIALELSVATGLVHYLVRKARVALGVDEAAHSGNQHSDQQ